MEEKKLTDEEIVKAFEDEKQFLLEEQERTGNTPDTQLIYVRGEAVFEILDLIHRLQAENDRLNDMKFTQEHCDLYKENEWLKAEIKRELADHEEFTKKANEEIERLTEELDLANETIDRNNKRYEKVSIERQKALDRVDYLEDALLEKIRRNAETQKQVDELENRFENKTCCSMSENCSMVQQAVKDTAKEIIKWIKRNGILEYGGYVIHDSTIEQICKKYGVEVE